MAEKSEVLLWKTAAWLGLRDHKRAFSMYIKDNFLLIGKLSLQKLEA